ncbi:MAG: STAS domain-containing protein [Jannaschia sp.]
MPDRPETDPSARARRLPARADISAAGPLREWFLSADGNVELDASGVEVLTTPVLQVLMAGRDWMRDADREVRIAGPSPAFLDCMRILGTDLDRLTHVSATGGTM